MFKVLSSTILRMYNNYACFHVASYFIAASVKMHMFSSLMSNLSSLTIFYPFSYTCTAFYKKYFKVYRILKMLNSNSYS